MTNVEPEMESYTLFVGEGDFSFSANYIVSSKSYYEKVYASCFTDQPLTDKQLKNMDIIMENGGLVFIDIDATSLENHPQIKDIKFSKIIFNFPHIAGKMNIRANRQLVENFFLSSKNILKDNGMVVVTLCRGQGGTDIEQVKRKWCDTWQIVRLAASATFVLYSIQPFNAYQFDKYQCTGFRGQQKPFNTEGALSHMFKLASPVCLKIDVNKSYYDVALYLKNVGDLFRNIYSSPLHPYKKVSCILNNIAESLFHSIDQDTICDLLTCMKLPFVNLDIDCIDIGFCKECMRHLISLFFLRKKSHSITSIRYNICCIKNICINSLPFHCLQAYFFDNTSNLLTYLPLFLNYLKRICTLNTCSVESSVKSILSQDYEVEESVHQGSDKKDMAVKSIFSLYASYSVYQGNEFFFYSDVDFFLVKNGAPDEIKSNIFKFGSVLQVSDEINNYFCILFDINVLSHLNYHIMDYRVLLSESSFYTTQILNGSSLELYRPIGLYPPTYIHDVSFYIDPNFNENNLFLVSRNATGYLIKSITLIDSYYDDVLQKHSKCYRFEYQSCDQAFSRSEADCIHSKFMRRVLQNSLNVSLR